MEEALTPEQVVKVATRLFAGLGYDMTSLDLISDALGVPASKVVELAGDKRELYMRALERIFEGHRVRMQAIVDGNASAYAAAHQIADAYLDFYVENPELLALWAHRGVADAMDVPEAEDRYVRPLMRLAAGKIREAVSEDIGAYSFLGVMMWCVNGFLGTGVLAPKEGMWQPEDPQALKYFRTVLHTLLDRMLTRPADPWGHDGDGGDQASGEEWTRTPST